jgi:hypothetical protein
MNEYMKSISSIIKIIEFGSIDEKKQVKEQLSLMIDKLKSSQHSTYTHFKVYCSIQNLYDSIKLE